MSDRNNNSYYECRDFIRYIYQEGVRNGVHLNPSFYPEIIEFIQSPEGRKAYRKFISINPARLGISNLKNYKPKRIFQS